LPPSLEEVNSIFACTAVTITTTITTTTAAVAAGADGDDDHDNGVQHPSERRHIVINDFLQ